MKVHFWYYGERSSAGTQTHTIKNYSGPIPNVGDSVSVFKDREGENEILHFRVSHRQFEFYPNPATGCHEAAVIIRE